MTYSTATPDTLTTDYSAMAALGTAIILADIRMVSTHGTFKDWLKRLETATPSSDTASPPAWLKFQFIIVDVMNTYLLNEYEFTTNF